jgi:hypothetical protein
VSNLKDVSCADYDANRKLQFKDIMVLADIGNGRLPFLGKTVDSSILNRISTQSYNGIDFKDIKDQLPCLKDM